MNLKLLAKKFSEQDIEWRVQQCGQGKNAPWALIIPYITNRAIMQRLDDVCGPENWKNEYTQSPCGKGYLCGISIFINDKWVTRWDGAEVSGNGSIDAVKSTLSNSMKRAGVQWGIGRYLYQFEAMFADCAYCDNRRDVMPGYNYQFAKDKNKQSFGIQWKPKELESWALPTSPQQVKELIEGMGMAETIEQLKKAYRYAYNAAVSEQDDGMLNKFNEVKESSIKRIELEFEERKEKNSKEAVEFVRESISVINQTSNESAANGQAQLAITKASEIVDASTQRKAIIEINKAKDAKIKELKGHTNGN